MKNGKIELNESTSQLLAKNEDITLKYKRLNKNRITIDLKNEKELLDTADMIIEIFNDKKAVKKICTNDGNWFNLLFGYESNGEFKWYGEDTYIPQCYGVDESDEELGRSYIFYLEHLIKVDGGKEKIIEMIETILKYKYLYTMYQDDYILMAEPLLYVLNYEYPEYLYYIGKLLLNVGTDLYQGFFNLLSNAFLNDLFFDSSNDNIKLLVYILSSDACLEVFCDEYTQIAEEVIKDILEDSNKYEVFVKELKKISKEYVNIDPLNCIEETCLRAPAEYTKKLFDTLVQDKNLL